MRFQQPVGVLQRNTAAPQLGHNNYNTTQNNGNNPEIINTITGGATQELGFLTTRNSASINATTDGGNHNNLTTSALTNNYYDYDNDNDNNDDSNINNCITKASNKNSVKFCKNNKFDNNTVTTSLGSVTSSGGVSGGGVGDTQNIDEHFTPSTNQIRNDYNNLKLNNINESYLLLQNQKNQQQHLRISNEVINNHRFNADNCNIIDETGNGDRGFNLDEPLTKVC